MLLVAAIMRTEKRRMQMSYSRSMNPAKMVADTLNSLYINHYSKITKSTINEDEHAIIENESNAIFEEIRNKNLDFITDALAAHIIILNNITAVCHNKAKNSEYFKEYAELSIKASDQLRKSGLALAQIKNVILNIENLTIQQRNKLLKLNENGQKCCNIRGCP